MLLMTNSRIPIIDYNYPLTEDRIAKFPLENRDETKLLIYKENSIKDSIFVNLPEHVPPKSLFIFNDTKVIKARLIFKKEEGSKIEVFCLNEVSAGNGYAIWNCYVGNSKRWKNQELKLLSEDNELEITASRISSNNDTHLIRFKWSKTNLNFKNLLESLGQVPLPPYLNRAPIETDSIRYQTIYAKNDGSVAAPTAGLHFTSRTFQDLEKKQCTIDKLTLHVGAGTFKPVMVENALDHPMHEEKVIIKKQTIELLLNSINNTVIPVGTTSMRSLESIYWVGLQIYNNQIESLEKSNSFFVNQWDPYQNGEHISSYDALMSVLKYMEFKNITELSGYTRVMILPGYSFKISKALVTNFHQPKSTLLLLVAALIGDNWQKVYKHALESNYRFLSYGDSSLLFPELK